MAKQTTAAGAPRRRRSDADRSVQAILAAALEALAGDPDASMAEIARRAGVVRATIYAHFPTRESLERVLLATWQQLSQFHSVLGINISRLSTKELHRRHLPITTQFIPLLERGQAEGVFRSDVSAVWLIAVIRAIVHTASTELQGGRLAQADVERTMLTTALAAVASDG